MLRHAEEAVPLVAFCSSDHADREGWIFLPRTPDSDCRGEGLRRGVGSGRKEVFAGVGHLSDQFEKSGSASFIEGQDFAGIFLSTLLDHDGVRSLD